MSLRYPAVAAVKQTELFLPTHAQDVFAPIRPPPGSRRPYEQRAQRKVSDAPPLATEMATRAVLQVFERYQKERVSFVTQVAEMAKNPQVRRGPGRARWRGSHWGSAQDGSPGTGDLTTAQNIEALQQAGAMALLRPLLLDNVPRWGG